MIPHAFAWGASLYGAQTLLYVGLQAIENWRFGRLGPHWAPVWWIALTWPFWIIVIACDLKVDWEYRRGPKG